MTNPLEPAVLTAEKLLAWRRRGNTAPLPALVGAILSHQAAVSRRLTPGLRPRRVRGLSADLLLVPRSGGLTVTRSLAVGAPATAILVEELACCGVKAIIGIDIGASLDAGLSSGTVVLIDNAVIDDGTSPHYAPGVTFVVPNPDLTSRLSARLLAQNLGFTPAAAWSTDAPLRETPAQIARYRALGASLVDMETAALFASASALGIAAASVLVVADELFDGWRPPSDMPAIQSQLRRLATIAAGCLRP